MLFDRHANLKYKYGNRHFCCREYYVDTLGKNARIIQDYIKNQLEEDYMSEQISLKEFVDPFTGEKKKQGKEIDSR
jgi:putative transposase